MRRLTPLKKIIVITALFLTLFANLATASSWGEIKQSSPWYYAIGIGLSIFSQNKSNIITTFDTVDDSSLLNLDDFTFKLFGGYRLDPFLALEFGVSELGTTVATTNGGSIKLFTTYTSFIDLKMTHIYNKKAALFAKIGPHFWVQGPDRINKLAEGTDLSVGAGLEFNLYGDSGRMMRVEWNRYLFDKIYLHTADTLTLNLVFKH